MSTKPKWKCEVCQREVLSQFRNKHTKSAAHKAKADQSVNALEDQTKHLTISVKLKPGVQRVTVNVDPADTK